MSDDVNTEETCVVCGKLARNDRDFSHIYHKGRRFSLCCPLCMQLFQRAPDRFAAGERCKSLIEELLDQMKWK
ncbi:MAG: hypothetical protein WC661_01925 [Opitutaceae bacterium]|jgi:hypothetical protein